MNKPMLPHVFLALACAFLTPKITIAEPINLSASKHIVSQYYDTGSYQRELSQITQKAIRYIDQRAAMNKHTSHPQKLALILDIDETSLSNYAYMKQHDFGYDAEKFHRYILQGSAAVIQPTLRLYQAAQKQHISVFFITGRKPSEAQSTEQNLYKTGYRHWNQIFYKSLNSHINSVAVYKSGIRKKITKQGYTIIASIGDQISDCQGGYTEKCFKLPNPWYSIP